VTSAINTAPFVVGDIHISVLKQALDTAAAEITALQAHVVSAKDAPYNAKGDGTTDDTAAINSALAASKYVILPAGTYKTTGAITIPADTTLVGIGKPTIRYYGTTQSIGVIQTGGTGVTVRDLTIDGGAANSPITPFASWCLYVAHDDFTGDGLTIKNGRQRSAYLLNVKNARLRGGTITPINGPGIAIYGCAGCTIDDIDLTSASNVGSNFGVHVSNGTNRCLFRNLRCFNDNTVSTRSLELLGMTYDCWGNRVTGCHAEGTGDNGISITGYMNSIAGNVCRGNYHGGIVIYGKWNSVTGNQCWNNGQRYLSDATVWGNIEINPSFGGEGAHNTISGNSCIDDQASPTADTGIRIRNNAYNKWVSGNTFTSSNRYCYVDSTVPGSGLAAGTYQVYAALTLTSAAAGNTPPTHTTGTVSDGTIDWTYLFTAGVTNLNGHDNYISGNVMKGHRTSDEVTDSTGNGQTYLERDAFRLSSSKVNTYVSIKTHNADPIGGGIIGNAGDLLLRKGGGFGTAGYLKTGSDGSAQGWSPINIRAHGTLASRPSSFVANGLQGLMYFDETNRKPTFSYWEDASNNGFVECVTRDNGATAARPAGLGTSDKGRFFYDTSLGTAGKPIWWDGAAWRDAAGTTV
jgi:parallel beta-helix repeat protein